MLENDMSCVFLNSCMIQAEMHVIWLSAVIIQSRRSRLDFELQHQCYKGAILLDVQLLFASLVLADP